MIDEDLLRQLSPEDRALAIECIQKSMWLPQEGPQTVAYFSEADVIGYGGAAGGGKTDLAIGKALTAHQRSIIFRREATQLTPIIDRTTRLVGTSKHFNGQKNIWRLPHCQIQYGSVPHSGDETSYQGHPYDFMVFDEATNFLEMQIRFLMGWNRTENPKQKCQALLTFNPPTTTEGRWVINYFAPWINKKHPNRAKPGELRWFAMINGKDTEVPDNTPILVPGEEHPIIPKSRTFIPSRVTDNKYYMATGYMSQLQAMPEPLRTQMLYGDFEAGMEDDAQQIIPSAWVKAAMDRWSKPDKLPEMDCMGVDVARGGKDSTVIARRHGKWFDQPLTYQGEQSPDGPKVAGLVIAHLRDQAPIHIDVIGVGASPYDFLVQARQQVRGVNVSEASFATDKSGRLHFFNLRTEIWWKMREALDPANNSGIALPPDDRLAGDLCAPLWRLSGSKIQMESREDIVKRIGRSPDFGTAYVLANMETVKVKKYRDVYSYEASVRDPSAREYNPLKNPR